MRPIKRGSPCTDKDESNSSLDPLRMKSVTFSSIKVVIFTKLESGSSPKRTKNAYKIDTDRDHNLIPFRVFRILFPRSMMAAFNGTIEKSIVLKTYNQSNRNRLAGAQ